MKTHLAIITVSALALAANAQTTNQVTNYMPPLNWVQLAGQEIATSTNWVVVGGYGHTVKGTGKNLIFGEVGYNFNNYAGLIGGYDYLWGSNKHQFNSVYGGLTLQLPMHPFTALGSTFLTNVVATPFVFDQVATSSSSTVANITGVGIDFSVTSFANLELHAGVSYEKRVGDKVWDGEYGLIHLAVTRNF